MLMVDGGRRFGVVFKACLLPTTNNGVTVLFFVNSLFVFTPLCTGRFASLHVACIEVKL